MDSVDVGLLSCSCGDGVAASRAWVGPYSEGQTALMPASMGGNMVNYWVPNHLAVMRVLLKDGRVPIDARDEDGRTALWWACSCGLTERARVLLLEGLADHTIADDVWGRPMAMALRHRHEGCIRLLEVGDWPATHAVAFV